MNNDKYVFFFFFLHQKTKTPVVFIKFSCLALLFAAHLRETLRHIKPLLCVGIFVCSAPKMNQAHWYSAVYVVAFVIHVG